MNTFCDQPKKRVAVYIRTKGECSEQNIAYQLQLAYSAGIVEKEPSFALVGVYTDEGYSSFSMKFRDGFDRMISDALSGMIDTIIVKSISRFSRNMQEAVAVIRQLAEKGIEVVFEREGFGTLDTKGKELIEFIDALANLEKGDGDQ